MSFLIYNDKKIFLPNGIEELLKFLLYCVYKFLPMSYRSIKQYLLFTVQFQQVKRINSILWILCGILIYDIELLGLAIMLLACYKQHNEEARGSCILQVNSKYSVELKI